MNFVEIIDKKKKGKKLTADEICFFIDGVVKKTIPDYQISALLMAICLRGMDTEETFLLTEAMKNSGEALDLSFADGVTVDKHSTGGVSDTVTLVAVPALACAGLKVVKLSGRGLSHTGGTIDKLESIPSFNTALTPAQIKDCVKKCGAVICSQTNDIAPADKILYELRDVTATVDNISLIASSVMSKKLAGGSGVILLDVKYGSGAFVKTAKEAAELARLMVKTGEAAGKKCAAVITSMQQPLTKSVGCDLELISALNVLKGEKNDLYAVSREICGRIIVLSGIKKDLNEAFNMFDSLIKSGKALEKFGEIITCQGGDKTVLRDYTVLKKPAFTKEIYSKKSGYAAKINAVSIGEAVCRLGGGREKKGDTICHSAGLEFFVRINGYVKKGGLIAKLYSCEENRFFEAEKLINSCYKLSREKVKEEKLIYAYVTPDKTELL